MLHRQLHPPERHLLLVEDDADLRAAMVELLTDHGYQVVEAANGHDAVRAAQAHPPALILLDMMMPVMDGWGFLRHRAADPALAVIPVIVLSAQRIAEMPYDVLSVVLKPVSIDSLFELIERFIQRGVLND